ASAPARERFAREAKAAAKLKSEHVARAIDFGFLPEDGPPYMVLELLEGQNLAERLAQSGPIEPKALALLMLQACEALREAHEEGIVHRDLKPSNLFVTKRPNGTPCLKVLDFGIAKTIANNAGALTKTATTMGSPFYMSPEQMRSAKSADQRSDIWSLGVTMYELSTGRVPFIGETVTEVAIMVIECAVESPRKHRPDLPVELERIIMRCLEKSPARRFRDVDELAAALAAFAGVPWESRKGAATVATSDPAFDPAFARTEQDTPAVDEGQKPAATVPASPALTMIGVSKEAEPAPPAPPKPSRSWVGVTAAIVGVGAVAGLAGLFLIERSPAPPPPERSALLAATSGVASASAAVPQASASASSTPDPSVAIDRVVKGHEKAKAECFKLAQASAPSLAGKLVMRFTIREDGTPKNIAAAGDGFPEAAKTCFIGVFSQMLFPPPADGKEVSVVYPMVFTAPAQPKVAAPTKDPATPSIDSSYTKKQKIYEQLPEQQQQNAPPPSQKGGPSNDRPRDDL
ncbi:MAG: serine/threonine protein kinase, partial [Myxococcales bacterium]|nr:serine/threonine protein kinase [Myxococcales bacterium]